MSHLAGILAGKHFAQKDVPSLVGRKYIVTGGQSLSIPNGRDSLADGSHTHHRNERDRSVCCSLLVLARCRRDHHRLAASESLPFPRVDETAEPIAKLPSLQSNADAAIEYIRTGNLHAAPKDYQDGFHGLLGEWKDDSADGGQESGEVHAEVCDFRDLKAVAQLGKKLAERFSDRLDGLLANAGLGVNNFALTKDGYE